jgi:hypothetical protein
MKPVISLHPIEPTFDELLSPRIVLPNSSCVTDDDEMTNDETNSQHQLELHMSMKILILVIACAKKTAVTTLFH